MEQKPIKGLVGNYFFNEIIVDVKNSTEEAVDKLMKTLTVEDKGVEAEIKRLKRVKPYNDKYAQKIKVQIAELETQLIREYYAHNDQGQLTIPPGFWYFFETLHGDYTSNIQMSVTKVGEREARYYQVDSVKEALKYKRSIINIPTGGGKSVIISMICKSLADRGLRVLIIVPTINLVKQMLKDIALVVDPKKICGIGGKHKFKEGSQITVATINSGKHYSDAFDAVLIDECHHSSSMSYYELATYATKSHYFYGLTATPMRGDGLELGFHGILGPVVYKKTTRELIKEGFLCEVSITCVSIRGLGRVRPGTNDQIAYKHLSTHEKVMSYIANMVKKADQKGLKVLVLFKTVEPGFEFCEYLNIHEIDTYPAHAKNSKPYDDFVAGKTNVLVSNSSLLGEGVDIPDLDFVISIVQNSSESLTRQVLGRGLRLKKHGGKLRFIDISTAGFVFENENANGEKAYFDVLLNKWRNRMKVYQDVTDDIVTVEV